MKKVILFLTVSLFLAPGAPGAVAGRVDYVTRDVEVTGSIDALVAESSVAIEYRQTVGAGSTVRIEAAEDIIDFIEVNISGTTLRATVKGNNINLGNKLRKVVVTSPILRSATVKSSGNITLKGNIVAGNLTLKTSSSGKVQADDITCDNCVLSTTSSGGIRIGNLQASTVVASTGSSGSIDLSGTADDAEYKTGSSGKIRAGGLKALKVKATSQSSGSITCHAVESITARAASSGRVLWSGDPERKVFTGNTRNIKKQ